MQTILIILGCVWILAWPVVCIGAELIEMIRKNNEDKNEDKNDEQKFI